MLGEEAAAAATTTLHLATKEPILPSFCHLGSILWENPIVSLPGVLPTPAQLAAQPLLKIVLDAWVRTDRLDRLVSREGTGI